MMINSIHSTKTTIIIVDDHTIVREGLLALLQTAEDMEVVATVSDGITALDTIKDKQPNIVVCDLGLPGLSGLEVIERSIKRGDQCKFLALSMYHDRVWIQRSAQAGAQGYLAKGSGIQDLLVAIRQIVQGKTFFNQEVDLEKQKTQDLLSHREKEVLTLVAQGHSSKEMSSILHISKRTVEHHRAHIMDKLKIYDIASLTRYAIRHGYVDMHLK